MENRKCEGGAFYIQVFADCTSKFWPCYLFFYQETCRCSVCTPEVFLEARPSKFDKFPSPELAVRTAVIFLSFSIYAEELLILSGEFLVLRFLCFFGGRRWLELELHEGSISNEASRNDFLRPQQKWKIFLLRRNVARRVWASLNIIWTKSKSK